MGTSQIIIETLQFFCLFAGTGMLGFLLGRTDESRHGLYLMLMASYDHVRPVNQVGTNDSTNLVTACWCCQFGKYKYSLDELGLTGPINLELVVSDSWVGLDSKSGK